MKKIIILVSALLVAQLAGAQDFLKGSSFTPKKGDFSFGVAYNPMSEFASYQPEVGGFAGNFVKDMGDYPHQMYFLGIDPKVSFQARYHISDQWSARASLGFSGSKVNYKEYIQDDRSYKLDPKTTNREEDCIHGNLNGLSIAAELEYTKSFGKLAFIAGFGAQFAVGGGSMTFDYGNGFGDYNNHAPSTMPYLKIPTAELTILNEYGQVGNNGKIANVAYARPIERYNVGACKAIAITCNMGIEYFFIGQMSITAAVTFAPIAFYFQPQTYTQFEGWNTSDQEVVKFHALVSPGSSAVLYGTQNIGVRLGFNYYL
jgi:hypothetical protein